MSRDLNTSIKAQIGSLNINIAYLWKGDFASNLVTFWTGIGDIEYNSEIYKGNGYLHSISGFSEDAGKIVSESISVRLSGVPTEMLSLALNNAYQSRVGYVAIAFLNDEGLIVGVRQLFRGTLDTSDINETGKSTDVTFVYKDEMARLKNSRELRWTPEEHKSEYPSDLGFDYVPLLESKRLYWGRADTTRVRV